MKASEFLGQLAERISDPAKWTCYNNYNNMFVTRTSDQGCLMNHYGALFEALFGPWGCITDEDVVQFARSAEAYLAQAMGIFVPLATAGELANAYRIGHWNDNHTHAEVLAAVYDAQRLAKEDGQ